jgi:hypothetical protein
MRSTQVSKRFYPYRTIFTLLAMILVVTIFYGCCYFSPRKDQVLLDAEYACAFPTPMDQVNKNPDTLRRTSEEEKRIAEEKQKLEEELRKLEVSKTNNPQ